MSLRLEIDEAFPVIFGVFFGNFFNSLFLPTLVGKSMRFLVIFGLWKHPKITLPSAWNFPKKPSTKYIKNVAGDVKRQTLNTFSHNVSFGEFKSGPPSVHYFASRRSGFNSRQAQSDWCCFLFFGFFFSQDTENAPKRPQNGQKRPI